jgi:carboxymethylenebutenolidase
MKEEIVLIPTKTGVMPTFVVRPEAGEPCHLVIQYMDVWGVREELYDIARRIAAFGYVCAVPDLYYRWGEIRTEFRDKNGRMISFTRLTSEQQAKTLEPLKKLSDGMVVEDTAALLEQFASDAGVHAGGIGTIGYCMGGRHVLRVASEFPERMKASASLHGTLLVSPKADSAHLSVHKIRGEVYCGFAEHDDDAPPATIEEISRRMREAGVVYRHEIHPGATHGYSLPDRDVHDKQATLRDWELILAMFQREIAPYGGRPPAS